MPPAVDVAETDSSSQSESEDPSELAKRRRMACTAHDEELGIAVPFSEATPMQRIGFVEAEPLEEPSQADLLAASDTSIPGCPPAQGGVAAELPEEPLGARLREELVNLLECHEMGLSVSWPDGHNALTARAAVGHLP